MSTSEAQPSASAEAGAVVGAGTSAEESQTGAQLPTSTTKEDATREPSNSTQPTEPTWPDLRPDHPLRKLQGQLPDILSTTGYDEVWGVRLSAGPPTPFSTTLVLQKFLRANANDIDKAAKQLRDTLTWRKEFQPLKAADEEVFDADRFGGLGYITTLSARANSSVTLAGSNNNNNNKKEDVVVVTWNIYGAVRDPKKTFGDLDGFLRYRVALMERSIQRLGLTHATQPIADYNDGAQSSKDPYQIVQVHDYLSVKFLRMDPATRAASQRTIALFQAHYPEMLARKFFVNVPFVMGWLFAAMKMFVARETSRKLTMLTYGKSLVDELGPDVPASYGGRGPELEVVGETVRLGGGEGDGASGSGSGSAGEGKGITEVNG